jgi:hypothetical protein
MGLTLSTLTIAVQEVFLTVRTIVSNFMSSVFDKIEQTVKSFLFSIQHVVEKVSDKVSFIRRAAIKKEILELKKVESSIKLSPEDEIKLKQLNFA